jgi:hypothetical protein
MQNRYGNNIESTVIKKIRVPLFDAVGKTLPGVRYYFPENPTIDNSLIVGIEAHLNGVDIQQSDAMTIGKAQELYVSFYSQDKEEIFYNVPLVSLFGDVLTFKKNRIKPYLNRLKSRMCYVYNPANSTPVVQDLYVDLTFYLRTKTTN